MKIIRAEHLCFSSIQTNDAYFSNIISKKYNALSRSLVTFAVPFALYAIVKFT